MKKLINTVCIMWVLMFFIMMILTSCSAEGENKTVVIHEYTTDEPETPVNNAEKFYTILPIASADFYYFTDSKQLYKFSEGGAVNTVLMYVEIKQSGEEDNTLILPLNQFFRINGTIYFSASVDDKDFFCSQSGGVVTIMDESDFPEQPIKNRVTMNNGHFSIVTGNWTVYEISDVRNLTTGSGISRTIYVSCFYLANDYNNQNGMFFVCHDIGVTVPLPSGLYFYPENQMSQNKIIDEGGDMW